VSAGRVALGNSLKALGRGLSPRSTAEAAGALAVVASALAFVAGEYAGLAFLLRLGRSAVMQLPGLTDVALLERLLLETEAGERLLAYVEVSRRLPHGSFEPRWLARIPGAPTDLLRGLLRALSEATGPEVTASLRPLLDHPEPSIRTLAIEGLAHPGNAAEIGPLLRERLRTDRECVYYVVRALGRLRYAEAAPDLIAFYGTAEPLEKVAVLEAVGAFPIPAAARFLEAELHGRDRERRRAAAAAAATQNRAATTYRDVYVFSREIAAEARDNALAVTARHQGRRYGLTGRIDAVQQDGDNVNVSFDVPDQRDVRFAAPGDHEARVGVACLFRPQHLAQVLTFRRGDRARFTGTFLRYDDLRRMVWLERCEQDAP